MLMGSARPHGQGSFQEGGLLSGLFLLASGVFLSWVLTVIELPERC